MLVADKQDWRRPKRPLSVAKAVQETIEGWTDGGTIEVIRDEMAATKAFVGQLVEKLLATGTLTHSDILDLIPGYEEYIPD